MRILFIPTSNSGVTYWRFYNYAKAIHDSKLAEAWVLWYQTNIHEVHPWQRDIFNSEHRWRITKEIENFAINADAIIFGMLHGPGVKVVSNDGQNTYVGDALAIFKALRDMLPQKPILTEIDDNMLSTAEYNPAFSQYAPEQELREVALTQFKESSALITSTPYLAEIYSEFNPNIYVRPNCIDFSVWDKLQNKPKKGLRIGWAGAANHEEDLRVLEDVIPRVISAHPEVKFVFLHGCPHYLRGIKGVEYIPKWSEIDKYPKLLAKLDFDIGLAPLVDNAFNRGKSNLRWLEYSALGIPTIASNVGHFTETIEHMKTGFLADTSDDFVSYIELLIKDKLLRKKIGQSAKNEVRKSFNVVHESRKYVSLLQSEIIKANDMYSLSHI